MEKNVGVQIEGKVRMLHVHYNSTYSEKLVEVYLIDTPILIGEYNVKTVSYADDAVILVVNEVLQHT